MNLKGWLKDVLQKRHETRYIHCRRRSIYFIGEFGSIRIFRAYTLAFSDTTSGSVPTYVIFSTPCVIIGVDPSRDINGLRATVHPLQYRWLGANAISLADVVIWYSRWSI